MEDAIQAYKEAIRLNPDDVDAHNNLGDVYRRQGNLDLAIELIQNAIKLNPKNSEAHLNFGNVYIDQKKPEEAIQAYRQIFLIKASDDESIKIRQAAFAALKQLGTPESLKMLKDHETTKDK